MMHSLATKTGKVFECLEKVSKLKIQLKLDALVWALSLSSIYQVSFQLSENVLHSANLEGSRASPLTPNACCLIIFFNSLFRLRGSGHIDTCL